MESMTRSELERAVARVGPFRPELLERMSDEELAEAANSTGASFEELAANAREPARNPGREPRFMPPTPYWAENEEGVENQTKVIEDDQGQRYMLPQTPYVEK